jgi:hypothetical protein
MSARQFSSAATSAFVDILTAVLADGLLPAVEAA